MARYKYKAINEKGKYVYGKISADNLDGLEYLLKGLNLDLVSARVEKASISFFEDRLSTKDLITLFTHFEQLEKAGVSIVDSLVDIKNSSTSTKIRNLVQEIYETVKNGSLLSEALAHYPKIFTPIFIGLITTGEKTGNLHNAFLSIIEHLKWNAAIRRKTVKALRYPLVSLVVMFIVLWVMTTIVVPKVTAFLAVQEISLPLMTIYLVNFSNFMKNNTVTMLVMIPVIFIIYKILRRVPKIALKIDQFKLYVPVFGEIINKLDASRFCHFFALTFKSGIGILDCLDTSKQVIENRAIKHGVDIARQKVAGGQPLAEAINESGYFSTLVVRMFRIGEATGNMEEALDNVRFFYDQEINDSIEKVVGMIQPTLIFIMGGMMAWITAAVFGPIYGSFSKLG